MKETPGRDTRRDVINQWNRGEDEQGYAHPGQPMDQRERGRNIQMGHSMTATLSCPLAAVTGMSNLFFTRYSRPRQVILSVKKATAHTTALTASRRGTSHNFAATPLSPNPQTPAVHATLRRTIKYASG